MKKKTIILASICALLVVGIAVAATDFTLPRQLIGAGGGASQSGEYAIHASIGQAVAGYLPVTSIELHSGFWNGSVPKYKVFLSAIQNSSP